jgi:hypothetical protein
MEERRYPLAELEEEMYRRVHRFTEVVEDHKPLTWEVTGIRNDEIRDWIATKG